MQTTFLAEKLSVMTKIITNSFLFDSQAFPIQNFQKQKSLYLCSLNKANH